MTGLIHWYVPPWLAAAYPDITDWNNLNKYADKFKTTESGDKGQFLGSNPSFVYEDAAIIRNLKLNFKVVNSGSEDASIAAFRQAEAQKTWLIGYFYDPQWLLAELPLVAVKLPPYTAECYGDYSAAARAKIACDYPEYALNKIVATKFANEGGAAYTLVKNFTWKNADQNAVAYSITKDKMAPLDAAKKWLDANPHGLAGLDAAILNDHHAIATTAAVSVGTAAVLLRAKRPLPRRSCLRWYRWAIARAGPAQYRRA